jgi:hypothetical protein
MKAGTDRASSCDGGFVTMQSVVQDSYQWMAQ